MCCCKKEQILLPLLRMAIICDHMIMIILKCFNAYLYIIYIYITNVYGNGYSNGYNKGYTNGCNNGCNIG